MLGFARARPEISPKARSVQPPQKSFGRDYKPRSLVYVRTHAKRPSTHFKIRTSRQSSEGYGKTKLTQQTQAADWGKWRGGGGGGGGGGGYCESKPENSAR